MNTLAIECRSFERYTVERCAVHCLAHGIDKSVGTWCATSELDGGLGSKGLGSSREVEINVVALDF
jgi:hypothetical protein